MLCSIVTHTDFVSASDSGSIEVHHQQLMRIDPSTLSLIILHTNGTEKTPQGAEKPSAFHFLSHICVAATADLYFSFEEDCVLMLVVAFCTESLSPCDIYLLRELLISPGRGRVTRYTPIPAHFTYAVQQDLRALLHCVLQKR